MKKDHVDLALNLLSAFLLCLAVLAIISLLEVFWKVNSLDGLFGSYVWWVMAFAAAVVVSWAPRMRDVVIGLAIFAFLAIVFVPHLLMSCVKFVRSKRTGVWK